jgi:hypothetical protein
LGDWPALNIVSLFLESGMRLGMILCAHWIFGRRVALLFGIWTIAATPLMVEWSVIPHGMHANAAIWPILGLIFIRKQAQLDARNIGALCALSLFGSFDNLPLVFWALIYMFWHTTARASKLKKWSIALVSGLLPLILLQFFGDLGFELIRDGSVWVRGLDLNPVKIISRVTNLLPVWLKTIPGSSLLPGIWLRVVWAILVYIGIAVGIKWNDSAETCWGTALLIGFVAIYALSPIYEQSGGHDVAIAYRHLAYITPLMLLLSLNGLSKTSRVFGNSIAVVIILLGLWGGWVRFNNTSTPQDIPAEPVGVVLAWKLGHDVPRLVSLIELASFGNDVRVLQGVGAGYATALIPNENIQGLIDKIHEHPAEHHDALKQGVSNAFAPGTTPCLDPSLLSKFKSQYTELYETE